MIRTEKKLKKLSERLNNKNPGIVLETIGWLRNEAPLSGAIKLLVEMYDKSESQAVKDNIRDFMNDIKESSARPEVIGEINKCYKQSTIAMLAASCWQSGLDYSSYTPDLAVAFNNGDYPTALECFTVIEESSQYLSRKIRDNILVILKENEKANTPEKSALMRELAVILS